AATPAALRAMACADGWHVRAGRRTHVPTFFLFWSHGCSAAAKFACLQRQKPAMFAQTPLFVYRHLTGAVCTMGCDGRLAVFCAPPRGAFSVASRLSNSSDILLRASSEPPPPWVACCAHHVQSFDLDQKFWCRGLWGLDFNEQIFGPNEQVRGRGLERLTKRAERIEFYVSDPLCQGGPGWHAPHPPPAGASYCDAEKS